MDFLLLVAGWQNLVGSQRCSATRFFKVQRLLQVERILEGATLTLGADKGTTPYGACFFEAQRFFGGPSITHESGDSAY